MDLRTSLRYGTCTVSIIYAMHSTGSIHYRTEKQTIGCQQYLPSKICCVQLIGSVCKEPVGEDAAFARKGTPAKKNRYKDKYPCEP